MYSIEDLAQVTVTVLVPYLTLAGKKYSKEIDKSTASKFSELYEALKAHFGNKSSETKALMDLEINPSDKDVQAAFRLRLIGQLNDDLSFTDILQKLIDKINQDEDANSFLSQFYVGKGGGSLAGDTTTDAPPPDVRKKKKKKGN